MINNTIVGNEFAMYLDCVDGGNTTLRNNNLTRNNYNLEVHGAKLSDFLNDIDTSNTIDGKPIYYWINQHNKQVPTDAGYVAIINSTNIVLDSLSLERNAQGLLLAYSTNITIRESNISNNEMAINLLASNNITLYHNNFINNTDIGHPFAPPMPPNTWDNGYPSGGNYWSNYAGSDLYSGPYQNETGSDGIGDTPYIIDTNNRDNYPLMSPYEYWSNPISGDINKDMKVNHKDLHQLAASYGSTQEEPNWNPNADINEDSKVNHKDLFILATNYGKKLEYP